MKEIIRKLIPYRYRLALHNLLTGYVTKSYSQEGEDLILKRLFEGITNGFFVDIGAHHPQRFSNTYLFYKLGWTGINIDAMPGSMVPFNKKRPKDINLEIPVSDRSSSLTYYAFSEPAFNGFSAELSEERIASGEKLLFKKDIQTERLDVILKKNLPSGKKIDFMSVDVEGLDLQVLRSNDWQLYRPTVLVVEIFGTTIQDVLNSEVNEYLENLGYLLTAKTANSCIYKL